MAATEFSPAFSPARETLMWSRALVDPALRAAVDTLSPVLRRIAGYHLGWWDEHGVSTPAASGRALRPALALLSAATGAGSARAAVPAAVAVELVHNFSLLHDDVMDGNETRRYRPTAWRLFGTGAAILAGDALLTLALDVLAASKHPAAERAMRMLSAAVRDLVDGQRMAFERRESVDPDECQRMAAGRTAALIGCSCALGALFGGGDDTRVRRLRSFGEQVGLAYQHVDDLLGIWGDPAAGKPTYADLRDRKKSLPVVYALASATSAGQALATLYRRPGELTVSDLRRMALLVESAGGRAWCQSEADRLLDHALDDLLSVDQGPAATELEALARLVTRHDR